MFKEFSQNNKTLIIRALILFFTLLIAIGLIFTALSYDLIGKIVFYFSQDSKNIELTRFMYGALVTISSIPLIFFLWVFRTQDARQQIQTAKENINRSDFFKASELLFDEKPEKKSIGLRQLFYLKNTVGVFQDQIDVMTRDQNYFGLKLKGADLNRANFESCIFCKINVDSDGIATDKTIRMDLSRANLSKANLIRANLSRAKLIGADLSGARMIEVDLSGANLRKVDLSRTDLRGAKLKNVNISTANLFEADLRGVKKFETILADIKTDNDTNFKEAKFNQFTVLPFTKLEAIQKYGMKFIDFDTDPQLLKNPKKKAP